MTVCTKIVGGRASPRIPLGELRTLPQKPNYILSCAVRHRLVRFWGALCTKCVVGRLVEKFAPLDFFPSYATGSNQNPNSLTP